MASTGAAAWYVAGNFIFGGLIGWIIVDPLTGAMWDLEPDVVEAKLVKKGDGLNTKTP